MLQKTTGTLVAHFSTIKDFRINRKKRHKLVDIMVIAVCAVICGADEWNAIKKLTLLFNKKQQVSLV